MSVTYQKLDNNLFAGCYEVEKLSETTALVRDERTGRFYVKKTVPLEQLDIYERLSAIESESKAVVFCVHRFENNAVIIEEFINGMTIERLVKLGGTVKWEDMKIMLMPLLELLKEMHDCNIIHRDISSANVMIDENNRLKLIDFGISRSVRLGRGADTEILGTAGYAPPEQFGFRQTDARSDIYSLGVLMNYMLTGAMPDEKLAGGEAGRIIKKCLSIKMDDRYQDVGALMADIYGADHAALKRRKRISKYIVGFRSGNAIHAVICMSYYLFFAVGIWTSFEKIASGPGLYVVLTEIASTVTLFIVPFVIMAFYKSWAKLFKFVRMGFKEWTLLAAIATIAGITLNGISTEIIKFILRV